MKPDEWNKGMTDLEYVELAIRRAANKFHKLATLQEAFHAVSDELYVIIKEKRNAAEREANRKGGAEVAPPSS